MRAAGPVARSVAGVDDPRMQVARRSGLLALWLLPGCLTERLWQADLRGDVAVEVETARFRVTALAVDERTDTVHELRLQAVQEGGRRGAETAWMVPAQPTLALQPLDASGADVVAGILQGGIGTVDRCDLAIDWYSGIDTDRHFTATLRIEGWLSPRLEHARIDAATAQAMLRSPSAQPAAAADAQLQQQLAVVERVDWRVLCPTSPTGTARALACLPATDGTADRDLLLQAGTRAQPCFLRVPLASLPLLAGVHRSRDTLLPRFRCEQRFVPEPCAGVQGCRPLPLPVPVDLVLRSHLRRQVDWEQLGLKELLTPFAALGDAAIWVAKQGPLGPLFAPEPPPEPPPRGVRSR